MLIGRRGSNWFLVLVSVPLYSNPSYAPATGESTAAVYRRSNGLRRGDNNRRVDGYMRG